MKSSHCAPTACPPFETSWTTRRTSSGLGMTKPVPPPGYPASESFPVRECMQIILDEEWAHRRYAERDLATLSSVRRAGLSRRVHPSLPGLHMWDTE